MERYRHITEIPGTEDPESGGVLLHRELDGREGVLGPALCGGLDGLRSIINSAFPSLRCRVDVSYSGNCNCNWIVSVT